MLISVICGKKTTSFLESKNLKSKIINLKSKTYICVYF
ncbi:hypothetical protein NU08_3212 [Flavobacterium anhuiense]|uniref:Uncharacterized protein n=1 Tax=Flavobacterium anhuiense TaxID=459526 RepID=A0A444VVY1_9FLAO|nr:hypothetical protein NU08_3212 [Flavobacterium anhuiense]